ncbi:galactofuranose ABC transporter, permease protein YjfF [Ancylobacter pratisalsi]|uniref:Sugar ABC transporter permease YjfF n=1 Tax=Ancylobacter pratisalsi TaxID=1745854 RepID=A0A6P1YLP2_9HYPH|nr:galactofuranose ABC transporter, permease protein YjfF [Ancylobacter pratisalsi]QIB34288.1 sugar ABC transporter permease YjfF [Ancylobacter pratisalsi]
MIRSLSRLSPVLATTAVFLAGFLICSAIYPNFASLRVVMNLLTDNAFLGIVAVGMTFVIISGGIDLSVGSVIGFTTVFLAIAIERWGLPPLMAFALVLVLCAGFGAAMGAVIQYFELPPFIVTLAGMFLARGVSFLLSTDSIPIDADLYANLSSHAIRFAGGARLAVPAMIMLLVVGGGMALLHLTRFGANVYALGGSRVATALMGINVARTTIAIYTLSSVLAGLSGIVFSLYTSSGYSLSGVGVELDAIAAVVIGGTLLSGGYGFVFGSFVGVLIQGLIQTYISFDGTLSSWWAKIATGLLLFAFIAFQQITLHMARRSRRAPAGVHP